MKVAAVVVAGGSGTRARDPADPRPKQYRDVGGRAPLARSVDLLLASGLVSCVQPVVRPEDRETALAMLPRDPRVAEPVAGGASRQESVLAGLRALATDPPDAVLVHDAVRPFATPALVCRIVEALEAHSAVLPALPVADTLKRGAGDVVSGTVDRAGLYAAQTPQGFRFAEIYRAHLAAAERGEAHTDDAAVAEAAGIAVRLVPGEPGNRKLTTVEDFAMPFEATRVEYRTGQGYDVHRLGAGDAVMLAGVRVPHDRTLLGHSDADVALHALTDALLGTIGAGDIGDHFPPSDPQWRGAASSLFVRRAVDLVRERGGSVVNADITLVCEAPRIGPYRSQMQGTVAALLGVSADRVGVKATTNEGLGFLGRAEGIAAFAVATVRLPGE